MRANQPGIRTSLRRDLAIVEETGMCALADSGISWLAGAWRRTVPVRLDVLAGPLDRVDENPWR